MTELALAHEYFSARGGAERVADAFHRMWPAAPVYTLFHDARRYGRLEGWDLRTSYLQPFAVGGAHRLLLPLYPGAAAGLRVPEGTELLLSSTSAFIKGVALPDDAVHVAYCHSPTRYLWDWSEQYLRSEVPWPLRPLVRAMLPGLREADLRSAARVDRWIANSDAVRDRISRYYGAASEVVHPPVDVASFRSDGERSDFWLSVGRLVTYKNVHVAVEAFVRLGKRLIVVGEGRERESLERRARDNVTFAGRASEATLRQLLASARGLIFPAEDDFGIVCVEALASGAPVVALASGGAPDIVRDGEEGALVPEPDVDAFCEAVLRVERDGFDPAALRRSAQRFDLPLFEERIRRTVADALSRGRGA